MMMMSLSAAIILDRSSLHVCTDDEQTNILIPQLQTHSSGDSRRTGISKCYCISFFFQRHHIVRMARVCAVLLPHSAIVRNLSSQSTTTAHSCGHRLRQPLHAATKRQTRREKGHSTNKWIKVSRFLSHIAKK
jgi:hypothetical protein